MLRRHPRNLLLAVGVGFGAFVVQGTLTTYVLAYAVQAGFARQTVLNALTVSSVGAVAGIIGYSALSDRVGRRPVVIAGAVGSALVAFLLFPMIDSGSAVLLTLALVLGQSVAHPAMYGPLAALCTELFSTRTRYTGASLGYQLAGLGAGVAPVVFASIAGAGTAMISTIVAACCLLTVLSVLALSESHRSDLTGEPAELQQSIPRPG